MTTFESELVRPAQTAIDGRREPPALLIGAMYERYYRMVRALCQLLLRNPADAEDAAQQTFLSAYGSLIDGTAPRNPAAWLATIARRECWARTAQRRRQPLELDETTDRGWQAGSALDEAVRKADFTALWKAINELPRQQRAAFLLREFSGLSYAEVAEALGASESAIESLLVRARRQLRDGLEPVLTAANLALTPVLLLRHRLARLLDSHVAGGAAGKAALIPATVKLGAAVAGTAVVVAGSVDVGVHVLRGSHRGPGAAAAALAGTGSGGEALELLVGRASAAQLFPLAFAGSTGLNATLSGGDAPTARASGSQGWEPGSPASASGAQGADPQAGGSVAPAGTVPDTGPSGSHPADDTSVPATETAPTDSSGTDQSGSTDTTPTDTTGTTDTTPADTGAASTPPSDSTPADTVPVAVPDTASGDTTPPDSTTTP
jgi:RNA polymerase sigma-70 factor, ECF subfamily